MVVITLSRHYVAIIKMVLGRFIGSFWFCIPYKDLSAYYWMHRWVRFLLGPLEVSAVYCNSHKGSYVHGCHFIVTKVEEKGERLFAL